jgi:2-dehydro-3-deoxyphosphogluconate aldolase/(4S)-4-hydroxy-2-oxoglutarate aldolase
MRAKEEILERLRDPGIIVILRTRRTAQLESVAEALVAGGITAVEVTMTTPGALEWIRALSGQLGARAVVGVGTVLDVATCEAAMEAGAEFVVSPVVRPELVEATRRRGGVIMLGAYTPTEAQRVHEAGADFVKLFPAEDLGARYIRALRAPLPHLRIVPTGGVDLDNVKEFFEAGCAAVGVGSGLVSNAVLQGEDWGGLTERARAFVDRVTAWRRRGGE